MLRLDSSFEGEELRRLSTFSVRANEKVELPFTEMRRKEEEQVCWENQEWSFRHVTCEMPTGTQVKKLSRKVDRQFRISAVKSGLKRKSQSSSSDKGINTATEKGPRTKTQSP